MKGIHHYFVLTIIRTWVACIALLLLVIAIRDEVRPSIAPEYIWPWQHVFVIGELLVSAALAVAAYGVSLPVWLRLMSVLPIVGGLACWVWALNFQAKVGQFERRFALQTGAVFAVPATLALLLLAAFVLKPAARSSVPLAQSQRQPADK